MTTTTKWSLTQMLPLHVNCDKKATITDVRLLLLRNTANTTRVRNTAAQKHSS